MPSTSSTELMSFVGRSMPMAGNSLNPALTLHRRSVVLLLAGIGFIALLSVGVSAAPASFKCKEYDLVFLEDVPGMKSIVVDKEAKTLTETGEDGKHVYQSGETAFEGDSVKVDDGEGFALELNMATGKGTTFLVSEPVSDLSCLPDK